MKPTYTRVAHVEPAHSSHSEVKPLPKVTLHAGRTFYVNTTPALSLRMVYDDIKDCPVTPEQADRFARLFAAASELLAALEAAANDVNLAACCADAEAKRGVHPDANRALAKELNAHVFIYRTAIAKAKGEA